MMEYIAWFWFGLVVGMGSIIILNNLCELIIAIKKQKVRKAFLELKKRLLEDGYDYPDNLFLKFEKELGL